MFFPPSRGSPGGSPSRRRYSPRRSRGGGTEEQGQHIFMDRQNSFYHLAKLAKLDPQQNNNNTNNNTNNRQQQNNNNTNNRQQQQQQQQQQSTFGAGIGGTSRILARPGSYNQFVDISVGSPTTSGNAAAAAGGGETQSLLGGVFDRSSSSLYGSERSHSQLISANNTIRFQVIIWNIGKLDVVTGAVPMTFRVTLFWNDTSLASVGPEDDLLEGDNNTLSSAGYVHRVWVMHGRHKAYQQEIAKDSDSAAEAACASVPVPPLSILNVSTFETIGSAEVDMLRESTRLMRWTCMYRATVIQEKLKVDAFPHDDHDIHLKLAILSQRSKGGQWDRRKWKLALATTDDTQSSTRIPHGLIVGAAHMPGFNYNKERGLEFQFCSLNNDFLNDGIQDDNSSSSNSNGNNNNNNNNNNNQQKLDPNRDVYLKVSLNVLRQSGYYDKNIVPLLALLNVVAVSVLCLKDTEFFQRGLLTLNIAFVAMSIRMTVDAHLPGVDYSIRLQHVLNEYFVVLMVLVLESMTVYSLRIYFDVSISVTSTIDFIAGFVALSHNAYTVIKYYKSKRNANQRLKCGWQGKKQK